MSENILDTSIPPIGVPILTPSKPTTKVKSLKSLAKNVWDTLKSIAKKASDIEVKEVAYWILGYIPEPIKKPVNEKIEAIMQLYKKWDSQNLKFERVIQH